MKSLRLITNDGATALGLIAYAATGSAEEEPQKDEYFLSAWDLDHIVLYNDPIHSGWYLAFNTQLGACFHVMFL
ncbi:MAG TPA: hypothetical protein VGJ21_01325 [Terracidiphilus sp.]|jgi:hypothetical protein